MWSPGFLDLAWYSDKNLPLGVYSPDQTGKLWRHRAYGGQDDESRVLPASWSNSSCHSAKVLRLLWSYGRKAQDPT